MNIYPSLKSFANSVIQNQQSQTQVADSVLQTLLESYQEVKLTDQYPRNKHHKAQYHIGYPHHQIPILQHNTVMNT